MEYLTNDLFGCREASDGMVMEPPSGPTAGAAGGARHMDSGAQLNPHFLGREFVRQYYTVLNQSPGSLYR